VSKIIDVAAAVIIREGLVLIARRSSGPRAGLWEFPGGKQEPGETLESCLAREIHEELGTHVQVKRHFLTLEHTYPDIDIRLHVFFCEALSDMRTGDDHQEFRWVRPKELLRFSFPEADRLAAEKLVSYSGSPKCTDRRTGN